MAMIVQAVIGILERQICGFLEDESKVKDAELYCHARFKHPSRKVITLKVNIVSRRGGFLGDSILWSRGEFTPHPHVIVKKGIQLRIGLKWHLDDSTLVHTRSFALLKVPWAINDLFVTT